MNTYISRPDQAFLDEMDRRMELPPLYATEYGQVRINPSPCDPRQFIIEGACVYILCMETEAKGKYWHGARFLTLQTAKRNLDRVTRKMQKAIGK